MPIRQMDLFADADPVDLVLPKRMLLSAPEVARAAGFSLERVRSDAAAGVLDALRFVQGFKYYIPRPSAAAYLVAQGVL